MQTILRIERLAENAVDASRIFHGEWLPKILEMLGSGNDLVVSLAPATYDHAGWRRAAVRDLARSCAPQRVNFVSGADAVALNGTIEFLANSPGVTGQYLTLQGGG